MTDILFIRMDFFFHISIKLDKKRCPKPAASETEYKELILGGGAFPLKQIDLGVDIDLEDGQTQEIRDAKRNRTQSQTVLCFLCEKVRKRKPILR